MLFWVKGVDQIFLPMSISCLKRAKNMFLKKIHIFHLLFIGKNVFLCSKKFWSDNLSFGRRLKSMLKSLTIQSYEVQETKLRRSNSQSVLQRSQSGAALLAWVPITPQHKVVGKNPSSAICCAEIRALPGNKS